MGRALLNRILQQWWFWVIVTILLYSAGFRGRLSGQIAPHGTAAALGTIEELRKDNARLRAMLIGRDQALANCQYEAQKQQSEQTKRLADLRADFDSAALNRRADDLIPTLRQLYDVPESVPFDWRSGLFRWPRAVVPYEIGQEPGVFPAAQKEQER